MALVIPINAEIDIFKARRAGREMAREIGLASGDLPLIEIAIAELASNILHHAGQGSITVTAVDNGLEIVSEDQGGGMADIEAAIRGGKKSGQGLGIGLAGVRRLMDQLEIHSEPGRGTTVITRKWLHRPPLAQHSRQDDAVRGLGLLRYGICTMPAYGAEVNGDAYLIREYDDQALLAVIDGLGHGERAAEASCAAVEYLRTNYRQELVAMLAGCHQALKRTRGAVIGLARVNVATATLTCSGVGNIRIKSSGAHPARPVSVPGIIGSNFRHARQEVFPFHKGDTLFLYSDGISDRLDPAQFAGQGMGVQQIAEEVVREFGRDSDDTTIIVAREE